MNDLGSLKVRFSNFGMIDLIAFLLLIIFVSFVLWKWMKKKK